MISIVPADQLHIPYLVENLRAEDRAELVTSGLEPMWAFSTSIELSHEAWTALDDGEPIAMWGLLAESIIGSPVGYPWLLTTYGVERHRLRFIRENRRWLASVLTRYPRLEVGVDAKYQRALTWLRHLGFTIQPGEPFCLATIEAN